MKTFNLFIVLSLVIISCVPAKKYNDLLAREKQCSVDLEKYKSSSLEFEGKFKDVETLYQVAKKDIAGLIIDTTELGSKLRLLKIQYDNVLEENDLLQVKFDKFRLSGAKETAGLQADLEAKNLELQRKEDALATLESELATKSRLLVEREQRVNELEELIQRKDEAVNTLKNKVANALKGFENKGLTVIQKNRNYMVIPTTTGETANLNGTVTVSAASKNVVGTSTTFTTSGMNVAGGAVINGEGAGGLNLAATQAGIGFYTNGSAAANLRMFISSSGNVGIGNSTALHKLQIGANADTKTSIGQSILFLSANGLIFSTNSLIGKEYNSK